MTVEEAIHELENSAWWDALDVVMEAVRAQSANDEQMKKAGSGAVYDSDHGLVQNCGQIKPSGWISVHAAVFQRIIFDVQPGGKSV